MEKRRIILHSEFSELKTGFSKMAHEILKRLHKTGKYELAEFANYGSNADPRAAKIPWKLYGVMPLNQQEAQIYQSNYNTNQFGDWKFEAVMNDFKPDFLISLVDFWMSCGWMVPKYLNILNKTQFIYQACIDSEPIPQVYVDQCKKIPYLVGYSEYAREVAKKYMGIDVVDVIPPGVDTKIHIPRDKREIKRALGLPEDVHIIQMVARNQGRKRFDRVFESYQMFKKKFPDLARKTILHYHCYKGDVGWNFDEYLKREGGLGDVLFTYMCPKCGYWWLDYAMSEPVKCRRCGVKEALTSNTNVGIPEDEYSKLFNLATVQVQGSICEGWGLCVNEAKANGVPVLATDYTALSEQMRNGGGIPIKVQTFFIEDRTMFRRAWFDRDDLVNKLGSVIRWAEEKDERYDKLCKEARECAEKYDWDIMAKRWENLLDTLPIKDRNTTWFAPIVPLPLNVEAPPMGLNNSEFVLWLYKNILNNDIAAKTSGQFDLDEGYRNWMSDLSKGRPRDDIEKFFRNVNFQHNVKAGVIKQKSVTELLDPNDKFRIVYAIPGTAGDVIVSTAVVDGIKKKYPMASIYFATEAAYYPLLEGNRNIKGLLPYSDQLMDFRAIEGCLDNKGIFDICYTPHILTQKMTSFIHGGNGPNWAKTYANYCDVELGEPFVPREEYAVEGLSGDYITVHTTSNQEPKNYERMDEIVSYINLPIVQLGGPNDRPVNGVTIDLRGKLKWPQTADVIAKAKLHVGVDAALGHIASAVGTPSIILYGGTFPSIAAPFKNSVAIEPQNRYGCLKACHLSKCSKPSRCINTIEPGVILEEIKKILPNAVKDITKENVIFRGKYNQDRYIGVAPIFACNYSCEYCISNMNRESFLKYEQLPVEKWIEILSKVAKDNPGIPISIGTAGEVSLYKEWWRIINETPEAYFRVLTNLSWDVDDILSKLNPAKIVEIVPSYHVDETSDSIEKFIEKIKKIQGKGIYVNLGIVDFPEQKEKIDEAVRKFTEAGIKIRREVFLGWKDGELYPKSEEDLRKCHIGVDYPTLMRMCGNKEGGKVKCRQQKLLIAPNGIIYNCHKAFYGGMKERTLKDMKIPVGFISCDLFGGCSECDSSTALVKEG